MPTTTETRVNDLIINKMSKAQFDALQEKSPTELYIVEGDSNAIYAEQTLVLPTAAEGNLGRLYQYIGATDANYTQNYFYKCVSDGAISPTYSWTQVNVQPAVDPLPSQSGQSGKYLYTNGSQISWQNTPTPYFYTYYGQSVDFWGYRINNKKFKSGTGFFTPDMDCSQINISIQSYSWEGGVPTPDTGSFEATIWCDIGGYGSYNIIKKTGVLANVTIGKASGYAYIAFNFNGTVSDTICCSVSFVGSDKNVGMSQQKSQPSGFVELTRNNFFVGETVTAANLGYIAQYLGTTDSNYTNGYFYKAVGELNQGVVTNGHWEQVNIQPAVDPLPSQSGHNGEFLTTNGTVASWATVDALPSQTGQSGKILGTDGSSAAWETKTTVSFRTWGANE